jgi:hypothetical protein
MLTLVISQVLLARMPAECVHILCNFVTYPEEAHFYQAQPLAFNCVIWDPHCSGIIAMHRRLGLHVTHCFKSLLKYDVCLAIVVQSSKFNFGSGGHDKTEDICTNVECAVETNGFAIFRLPTHEEVTTSLAACFCFREVRRVGVYVHDHI